MDSQKDATENLGSSRCSTAIGPQKSPFSMGRLLASLKQTAKELAEIEPGYDLIMHKCEQCECEHISQFIKTTTMVQTKFVQCGCGNVIRVVRRP